MTPADEAIELVDKFSKYTSGWDYDELAKQCALITVDELIKETGSKYWYDVKKEIEKL